ncbi:MAG: apolipoprotein N-acyltransferase, partial [Myxococcales bacterium]|nr:apolipoprotein N-acyltransferase [Myxococcales bacterium]
YGLSQLPFLEYAQVADLGGLPLLDWLVATVGCGLVAALLERRAAPAIAMAAALVLPPIYGVVRLVDVRAARARAPMVRVGVTQPNVSIEDKHDPRRFLAQLDLLRAQTRALEAEGAEVVVWPETSYRFPILRGATRDREGRLAIRGDGVRGPLIVGVLTTSGPAHRYFVLDEAGRSAGTFTMAEEERFNSAVLVLPDGRFAGVADKVNLLAFGEYTPFWELVPWLQGLPRGISPGAGRQILEVGGIRAGILNCYEDLLAEHVRTQDAFAPNLWINVTNNAWFGDTSAPHLHHMNARMRAIETRRDLVRSVNTGVSGHTAATGEDLVRTGAFVPATFVAEARLLEARTLWSRVGDWPTAMLVGALFGFVLARRRLTGRRIPRSTGA